MEYIFGIIALCIVVYFFSGNEEKKRLASIAAVFEGREPLTPEAFYEKYYKDKGVSAEVVFGVRKILEEQLDADLSKLSSSDDFSSNLNFFWSFDSMADVEIIIALEEVFGIKIEDSEAEKTCTVNDIIMLVANKLKEA